MCQGFQLLGPPSSSDESPARLPSGCAVQLAMFQCQVSPKNFQAKARFAATWFILFEFKTACADQDLKGVTSCHLWKDTGLTSGQGIRCFRGKCAKSFHGGVGSRDLEAGGEWGGNEGIIFSGKSGKSSVTQILAAQARVEMRRPWSEYGETEF